MLRAVESWIRAGNVFSMLQCRSLVIRHVEFFVFARCLVGHANHESFVVGMASTDDARPKRTKNIKGVCRMVRVQLIVASFRVATFPHVKGLCRARYAKIKDALTLDLEHKMLAGLHYLERA